MGPVYFTNYIARILVEERLNYSRREPAILDQIHPWRTIRNAAATIATMTQRLIKSINRELRDWVDTQSACTPGNLTLANC